MKKRAVFLVAVFWVVRLYAIQIGFTSGGNWNLSLTQANLTGGAGTGFLNPYPSADPQVEIRVRNMNPPDSAWEVSIRRSAGTWNTSMILRRWRSGPGHAADNPVSGGDAGFVEITTADVLFFSGSGRTRNIPVQYDVSLPMASLGTGTFATTVTYTVTEI